MALNTEQEKMASTKKGFMVVDAGPGTGKTHTITARYGRMLDKDTDSKDILMLTFTKNAAQEMRERITASITESKIPADDKNRIIRNIKAMTFDSLCLNIVMNSPEEVSDFFGFQETLSRGVSLEENETLNKENFRNFYAKFILEKGKRYQKNGTDMAAIAAGHVDDVYDLLNKLMSRGIIPLQFEWFNDDEAKVSGNTSKLMKSMAESTVLREKLNEIRDDQSYLVPKLSGWTKNMPVDPAIIKAAAEEDRKYLFEFIRDVYWEYIKECVRTNKLTFGVAELMAFAILYQSEGARKLFGSKFMMVDEFQDTNELQLKICLLLLREPNLCVVGDWKQGIYGFRYVSKENIMQFEDRSNRFIKELNSEEKKVPFGSIKAEEIDFEENYRSSSLILRNAFKALGIKATKDEIVELPDVTELKAMKDELYGDNTAFELILAKDRKTEADTVVEKIIDYVKSGRYTIIDSDSGERRKVSYKDIAVLSRPGWLCADVLDACQRRNVPAFLQGDVEIMSTREGKLALAWLRYVNNESDPRGPAAILADMDCSFSSISAMMDYRNRPECYPAPVGLPDFIVDQRKYLLNKRRRPNDLLTSIFAFYKLDNSITQSIINVISSAYSNSLLTIPDIIRLIEDDIEAKTKYNVEPSLFSEAVTIQTMHKSKGLEYPIVIVAGLDKKVMPNTKGDTSIFRFSDLTGIRCTKEYLGTGEGTERKEHVFDSWRHVLVKSVIGHDYSEERRLLFVSMTRAKQYLSFIAAEPSTFYAAYGEGTLLTPTDATGELCSDELIEPPVIGAYQRRRASLSVHDLMSTLPEPLKNEDDAIGKGPDYGERVHNAAYQMAKGLKFDSSLKETAVINEILYRLKDAKLSAEEPCVLPVGNVSVKGIVDLMAEFDDHIEIHDYKTDCDEKYLDHYMLQVSVYALVAAAKGKKVRCFIDFVSINKVEEVVPYDIERIEKAISDYYRMIEERQ